ncbi:MAG: DHH family phosphoesterase [Bdellovibrionales bacterium]|nr:DHH family phosphoesterase [Bdellovibrionales bacterium]
MIQSVVEEIKQAQNIILTTHRQCDGDGLGSELAMYFALKKVGKNVRIINVDGTPAKYSYLSPDDHIQYFDGNYDPIQSSDLALIFDTNDKRLVEPLYDQLSEKCKKIIFVDHHPVLKNGPTPTDNSIINIHAASTGELAYDIITALDIDLDAEIARSLYTSVVFDTQLFRYVRNSPRSHEICAELLKYEKAPSEVHKKLFGNFTAAKLKFVAQSLSHIEFSHNERIALLLIKN